MEREALRTSEAQRLIDEMEREEEMLLKRLQDVQASQKGAYAELQQSIAL